jgi:hypothetical protein
MKKNDLYHILLEEYDESIWKKYTNSSPKVVKIENGLSEIPMDIIRPLTRSLGYGNVYAWLNEEFEVFYGKTPIEMLKTEEETKVLRAFIMRMPL